MVKPHTNDIRMTYGWHTSEIRMTCEYIRMTYGWHTNTYGWHTNTYEWHTDDIRVTYAWHTSTYEWHTDDIRTTYEYIRVARAWHTSTCEWHTDDMRFERKIKLTFSNLFDNPSLKISDSWKNSLHVMAVLGYLPKLKMGLGLAFAAHFLHVFLIQMLLI